MNPHYHPSYAIQPRPEDEFSSAQAVYAHNVDLGGGYPQEAAAAMAPIPMTGVSPMSTYGQQQYASYEYPDARMNAQYPQMDAHYHQTGFYCPHSQAMVEIPQSGRSHVHTYSMSSQHPSIPQTFSGPLYYASTSHSAVTIPQQPLQHIAESQSVWQGHHETPQQSPQQPPRRVPASLRPQTTSASQAPQPPSRPHVIVAAPQHPHPQPAQLAAVEIPRRTAPQLNSHPSVPLVQMTKLSASPHPSMHMQALPQRSSGCQSIKSEPMQLTPGAVAKMPGAEQEPPIDYQQLLLLLAEDYINAAHGLGSLVTFYRRTEELQQYYQLMAMGLSCLEASLTQFRLAPQAEAQLVLEYCNLVFKETDNHDEVDKWTSKTILLCDRHKLLDIKFAMHHLSARALFVTKSRLALKTLDPVISAVEAYKFIPWIYALRFLRVTFTFQLGASHQDVAFAVQNLKAISRHAAEDDDGAIALLSATYEAMLHLRSMTASSIEDAKRAIAAAKSLQFHPLAQRLDQIWALLDCVEVICYLMEGNPALAAQKAEQMAPRMDEIRVNPKLNDDGLVLVPLRTTPSSLTAYTSGIFRVIDKVDHLAFQWLPRRDLWSFCFLINAITAQARTFADLKSEAYIREGLKILKENLSESSLDRSGILPQSCSLNASTRRLDWWLHMRWYFHIYMSVNACSRAEWSLALQSLDEAASCPTGGRDLNPALHTKWELFLKASILQGTGETEKALLLYQSSDLRLPINASHKLQDLETDLCILATLNSVLITIDPHHPEHMKTAALHQSMSPFIVNHTNKSLRAAHDLLRSILNPQDKLIDKKKHFHNCLTAARAVNNTQLVSIALSLMCTMFFTNVVGEQARKSVSSARALADRSKSTLWRSVAAGLQEQTCLRHGNEAEAMAAASDGEQLVTTLPDAVKANFDVNYRGA